MNRRSFLRGSTAGITAAALGRRPLFATPPVPEEEEGQGHRDDGQRRINVAFVVSSGANVIDLAGPWEVFQDAMLPSGDGHHMPFRLYTVSESTHPITATGGLRIVPHYSLRDAPQPTVVSVGAQRGSGAIHAWLREQAQRAEMLMSVCTGAFQLARAGLLDGRRATTHHEFWDRFEREFPRVHLVRGRRFVADDNLFTAGGLTSGIDLALHVVQRYFGAETAARTARYMEYESERWQTTGA